MEHARKQLLPSSRSKVFYKGVGDFRSLSQNQFRRKYHYSLLYIVQNDTKASHIKLVRHWSRQSACKSQFIFTVNQDFFDLIE